MTQYKFSPNRNKRSFSDPYLLWLVPFRECSPSGYSWQNSSSSSYPLALNSPVISSHLQNGLQPGAISALSPVTSPVLRIITPQPRSHSSLFSQLSLLPTPHLSVCPPTHPPSLSFTKAHEGPTLLSVNSLVKNSNSKSDRPGHAIMRGRGGRTMALKQYCLKRPQDGKGQGSVGVELWPLGREGACCSLPEVPNAQQRLQLCHHGLAHFSDDHGAQWTKYPTHRTVRVLLIHAQSEDNYSV